MSFEDVWMWWFAEAEPENDEVEPDDSEEVDEAPMPPAQLARIERAFREERRDIRASADVPRLRWLRANYVQQLVDGKLPGIAVVRVHDLLQVLDERITDLRAKRLMERRS